MGLNETNFKVIRFFAEGTFGRVFQCEWLDSKHYPIVCVKRIPCIKTHHVEFKMIMEEVYIISQLRHPNIVKFLCCFAHAGTINITMEYAKLGTLRDVINRMKSSKFPKPILTKYFCDLIMGLEYIHIRHVVHCDLKPENLLLGKCNTIKITDFGISNISSNYLQHSKAIGTPYYMAPEVILKKNVADFKTDIWALGCILYEMCTSKTPFSDAINEKNLLLLIRKLAQPKFDCQKIKSFYGTMWMHLCEEMLTYDKEARISLPEIFRCYPFISIPLYFNYFK